MNCRLPSIVCGVLFAIIAAEYVSAQQHHQYPAHIAVLGRAEIAGLCLPRRRAGMVDLMSLDPRTTLAD